MAERGDGAVPPRAHPRRPGSVKWADAGLGVILLGVGLYVLFAAAGYPGSLIPGSPGPALFPRLVAGILILLSLFLLLTTLGAARAGVQGATAPEKDTHRGRWRVGAAVMVLVPFSVFMDRLDLFLTLPVMLAAIMVIMGERRPSRLIVVPLTFALFVYVVFYRTFGVALPTYLF